MLALLEFNNETKTLGSSIQLQFAIICCKPKVKLQLNMEGKLQEDGTKKKHRTDSQPIEQTNKQTNR